MAQYGRSIQASPDGYWVDCWFEYDSGTSGVGKIKLATMSPTLSWGTWSSTVNLQNGAGTAYSIADNGWCNVDFACDWEARWVIAPILAGDTTPTLLYSTDLGQSWST